MLEDAVTRNRRHIENDEDKLFVSIGNANVYLPISKNALYPHISVETVVCIIPVYLKKFAGLQDLLIDYVNEVVIASIHYGSLKDASTSHHRSSSSLTAMGQMRVMNQSSDIIRSSHQNILQKGATRMKRMANTVKKNVSLSGNASAAGNVQKLDATKKRDICVTMVVRECSLRVQIVQNLFLTYSLHDFTGSYSSRSICLLLLEHEIELIRLNLDVSERFLTIPKLPEVDLLMTFPQPTRIDWKQRYHNRFPSSTTLSNSANRTSHSAPLYNSDGGVSVCEELSLIQLEVEVLKLELTTRQVSVLIDAVVWKTVKPQV